MSKMPWVRFFPSDWLVGTRGMSAVETGIYITLIATMYDRCEPLEEDHARLARLCGASNSAFKSALEGLISEGKITRTERGLWNDRVEKEQVYLAEKSEVGSNAARARWDKKDKANNVVPMRTQCEGNANQKSDIRYTSSLRSDVSRAEKSDNFKEEFEKEFWPLYPNKVGKPKALASFIAARKRADLQTIMTGLKAYVAKTDDRQWCNPTTWLNQDRWNDTPSQVQRHRHRERTIVDVIDELQEKANGHHQDNFFSGPTIDVFPSNGRGVATAVRSPSPTKWSEC